MLYYRNVQIKNSLRVRVDPEYFKTIVFDFDTDGDARKLAERLDGLPLALAIAGVFLGQTQMSCKDYLNLYTSAWSELYGPDSEKLHEYRDRTLYSTWIISLEQVRRLDSDAAQLFCFFAYLSNKEIWYDLCWTKTEPRPAWMDRFAKSRLCFDRAMIKLQDYSLIIYQNGSYRIHQCVHDWISEYFVADQSSYETAVDCVMDNIPNSRHPRDWHAMRRLVTHVDRLNDERFQDLSWTNTMSERNLEIWTLFGQFYGFCDQLNKAERVLERALARKSSVLGSDHTSTVWTMQYLGCVYYTQGKYGQAEQLFKQVLSKTEGTLDSDHELTLDTIHKLGLLYFHEGKLPEAEAMTKRALARKEFVLGCEHLSTLGILDQLGRVYLVQGKLEQAEHIHEQVLAVKKRTLDRDDPLILDTINNLGFVYRDEGKLDQAEETYKRALFEYERLLGHDHHDTRHTMVYLGSVYQLRGKLDLAKEMFLKAFDGFGRLGLDSMTDWVEYKLRKLEKEQMRLDK